METEGIQIAKLVLEFLKQFKGDHYFVNACRPNGMLDFVFPEYYTFEDLEYGINMLTILGYEINLISLEIE